MDLLAPEGPVYQAGTLSGNPLAMAAGIATLRALKELNPYDDLDRAMASWSAEIHEMARKAGLSMTLNRVGSMAGIFFLQGPVETFEDVMTADASRYTRFFHAMLEEGIYLAPSPFEAAFISTAHTPEVMDQVVKAAAMAFATMAT
jgi:glutamate-1-semialdehyde 2,1-aminomutase